jgi:hypothetical protein
MKKRRIVYILLAISACLIMSSVFHTDVIPSPVNLQQSKSISQPETKKIAPQTSNKVTTRTPINLPYEAPSYASGQHLFDDNLCNLDNVRINYKPVLKETIQRLDHKYNHYYYNLNDYIELNIYTDNMTTYFRKKLIQRVRLLHNAYIEMLGEPAKQKITLNLVITPNRADYLHYISFYSLDIDTSVGVYFGGLNVAFIDYQQSDDNALRTSIHETVHALHAHIIGKTPRMFNEGMAEFFEKMKINNDKITIDFTRKNFSRETLSLMKFFDSDLWSLLNTQELYYSSWAWITFMHSNNDRLQSLIAFMKAEQTKPCSAYTRDQVYAFFGDRNSAFEVDFYDWRDSHNNNLLKTN